MIKSEREQKILAMLREKDIVSVKKLYAALTDVSPVTIRRDIAQMAKDGVLLRVRGGVMRKAEASPRADPLDDELVSSIAQDLDIPEHDDILSIGNVDAIILPPIEGQLARTIHRRAKRTGVLCLDESGPDGEGTYLGIDNERAGFDIGIAAARQYAGRNKLLHCLVIGHDGLTNTRQRAVGFLKGLREAHDGEVQAVSVDARGVYMEAFRQARDALEALPRIDVIFGINDHSILAAIDAARSLRRKDILGYCVGGEGGSVFEELLKDEILQGFSAMFPQVVAREAINAIAQYYSESQLIAPVITPHRVITRANLTDFYSQSGDEWHLLASILDELSPTQKFNPDDPVEHSVLFIQHYPTHHWYRSLSEELEQFCTQLKYEYHTASLKSQIVAEMRHTRREIAARAAKLVKPGNTIIINRGETSRRLAKALCASKDLTVITNSLSIVDVLNDCPGIKVLLTGGQYRRQSKDMVGPGIRATMQNLRVDIAFFSVEGFSKEFGASCSDEQDAESVRIFAEFSRHIVVLADHSILGEDANFRAISSEHVDDIVTDFGVSALQRVDCSTDGIGLIVAGDPHQPVRIKSE